MSDLQNAIFPIRDQDVVRNTSRVKQLVDILQVDIASVSGESSQTPQTDTKTRKKYEVFVTGGLDPNTSAVTSSLFQTVFDQDHETQTANELLDITIGCFSESTAVTNALDLTKGLEDENGNPTGIDAHGKKIFKNSVLMMREKINVYKQYAQYLLGDSENYFTAPYESSFVDVESGTSNLSYDERIDEALFVNVKRLFTRDAIVKDEFVIKLFEHANDTSTGPNIGINTNDATALLLSDSGASTALRVTGSGGSIGTLKRSGSSGDDGNVGLIFYEKGVIVLDAKKIFDVDQNISGSISAVSSNTDSTTIADSFNSGTLTFSGSFIPNFWVSGSIDDIVDHVCTTRFGRTNATAAGFLNHTFINSSVYICRVAPSQANYSRNPSYRKDDGTLRFIEDPDDLGGSNPFAYITTVGLYDSNNNLLAVAKTSRPIEKNTETDLSVSVRIDY